MVLNKKTGDVMTKLLIGVLALLASVSPASAQDIAAPAEDHIATASVPTGDIMLIYGRTLPPIGFVQFCRENPSECRHSRSSRERVSVDVLLWDELNEVNSLVNNTVEPISDAELYGLVEFWTYPAGQGDCEDYVLLKRKLLIERGWPDASLLITVVRDENNEGHAVLTARTLQGDFILDNKTDAILTYDRTAYAFVKRQSHFDTTEWLSLVPQRPQADHLASWPR